MYVIEKIEDLLEHFGIKKEYEFDIYIKDLIREQVGADINMKKVELLIAKKTRMEEYNQFNYFLFKYNNLTYELLDGDLKIVREENYRNI